MSRRSELALSALLLVTALSAVAFVVVYAFSRIPDATQFLGLTLGIAFIALAAALLLVARRLVAAQELEHEYPAYEDEAAQLELEQVVTEGGERFTRRRLVVASASIAGVSLGAALIAPVVAFGPVFDLESFVSTPWHRGRRLVGEDGRPLTEADVEENDFYTAYPEGADREELGAPLVVVRLPVSELELPQGRRGWAPEGILAYSKICTHAGCAISLYRKPTFPPTEPAPALVCPCHYSTFDPARGGAVIFGPAGRPLPQLPLEIGAGGDLRAGGTFSGPVGPSWWGVRSRKAR
ncbi:MAG TPA: ubiquinol-cytochrome c reductase iron-sulfur subunit [Gaiellaceae bacterium]|nr:ubiquinol-cytochrome c reductase iron-sulfur subunit [Gaiellaceae bacterium]